MSHTKPETKYTLIQKILKKYKKFPAHICELWIQDEVLLQQFWDQHQMYGVTSDKQISQDLKNALPQAKIYNQNISSFRVPVAMGLCMMRWQQMHTVRNREKMFQKIADHMEPYGLFVFDIYTHHYFEKLVWPSQNLDISQTHVSISSRKKKKDTYHQVSTSFDQNEDGTYTRHDTSLQYISQSLPALKKLLKPIFESVSIVDMKGRTVSKAGHHVVVVCQKGW